MKKFNFKEIFIPTITLFIICVISAVSLGFTDYVTSDTIAEMTAKKSAEAMAEVLPANSYEKIEIKDGGSDQLYKALSSNKIVGYVASCTQKGYGGNIDVIIGIDKDGAVTEIKVLNCSDETPGLGQNVKSDEFASRFKGISDKVVFGKNVDAWTGATISSTAVKNAVNRALELYEIYKS